LADLNDLFPSGANSEDLLHQADKFLAVDAVLIGVEALPVWRRSEVDEELDAGLLVAGWAGRVSEGIMP
jgi:hypothetical protein